MAGAFRFHRETLAESWRQGVGGLDILHRYAGLVDNFIVERFTTAEAVQAAKGSIAIIALGGYGRSELYPSSDIDLLMLHDRRARKAMQGVAEALLYPLWDEGFEVGHSVRGVKDAVAFAQEDFHFQVALLDARLLAGSQPLFDGLLHRYRKKVLDGRRNNFVRTMEAFKAERWARFGSHTFLLEPHIKEGKGGLRDIQAMFWVAKGVFGLKDAEAMQSAGMLAGADRQALEASWSMLARLRMGLHHLGRRKNDHLIFEFQEELATAFAYRDHGGMRAVEHFMRDVYSHLQTVSLVTDLFFEHVHEVLGMTSGSSVEQQLERSIVLRGGTVRLVDKDSPLERPYLLMRLFLQSGRTGMPLHHRTRRIITGHLDLVNGAFRTSRRVARFFLELLTETAEVFPVLETMLATGLLTRYLPEFAAVESLAQHDLYHLYTVDRHQLQTLAELTRVRQEMPELFAEIQEAEVVYLAALIHDIGKGRQTDHSLLGEQMALDIGRRLHLTEEGRETLAFLVRYHLYLPENALRRDFSDQEFIRQAAELIKTAERLTMLYLLTIADSKATGPSAWSNWKASLLGELYLTIKSRLESGGQSWMDEGKGEEQGISWLREQVLAGLNGQIVAIDVISLPPDYLMSFSPDTVVRHLILHRQEAGRLGQRILLFPDKGERSWSLLVMGRDRPGLLAKFCGVLALHNLSVRSARIFTWPDATVVDVLEVAPMTGKTFAEQNWERIAEDLNLAVNYRLDVGYRLHEKMAVPLYGHGYGSGRQVQHLERKVHLDNQSSNQFTLIEVHGSDNPATLYQLTQTLADFGLTIHRARIATEVEQLIVVFYVLTREGGKLTDPVAMEKAEMTLMHIIGGEVKSLAVDTHLNP
ncbi:[protein-PII] uridylyltransferase [Desulfobulbus alkaliphilus]|uniref:[protein-PII] uridylyltransferase n=1 Tax=Desulfobulbus alkaliphilus TaxID=869814 RepID=UPI001964FD8B|nr:[protein-PII] uridylyltransferase [Desulfobulbus alkaliphilus]MBM9538122.1 [protein-PII] uridylyltransferase [Desulfobulbus alkaliphilus]